MLNLKDKKAGVYLRDIYMILIVGAIVVVFASMLVNDVANSYENTNMSDDWEDSSLNDWGATTTTNINENVSTNMANQSAELTKSFTSVSTVFTGVATIVKIIFGAPIYFASLISAGFEFVGAPETVVYNVKVFVSVILYLLIIFGVIVALLRGSKL